MDVTQLSGMKRNRDVADLYYDYKEYNYMANRMAKVICTIGPASSSPEMIRKLIENGMNVARLNFSHGTHDTHRETIKKIRTIATELGCHVGILQDLCGPKIRLGILPEDGVRLVQGEFVALKSANEYQAGVLPLQYPDIHKDLEPGESILIADGMMELVVERVEDENVICRIITGGQAYSRKGVNMPGSALSVSAFSDKDRDDLKMGIKEGVDYVAMSFVRSAEDLKEIRSIIAEANYKPKLIAKIEKPQAVENIVEILEVVDGVMVARGDLGVEVPLEMVPVLQKNIIRAARTHGKFTITATQMLMSMVSNPRPTRGEASDVANAVLDGTGAVMLSDESANGKYPIEACATLGRIAAATEPHMPDFLSMSHNLRIDDSVSLAMGRAAGWLAADIKASAIVAFTKSGSTALAVSQFRPHCPIIAMVPDENVCNQLAISWGVTAFLTKNHNDTDAMFEAARVLVLEKGLAKAGDLIILTAGVPLGVPGKTNLLRVLKV
jgi:pyruvate kinase